MSASEKHLLLVDASGFAYRAFFAMNPTYRGSDGFPTWAVLGFLSMVWRLLKDAEADRPDYGAAVFDAPGRTFRHKIYPDYKKQRVKASELSVQLPLMREAARTLGMEAVEAPNYEADDVIATLAMRAKAKAIRTTIVSSDKDFGQLVENDKIELVDPMARTRITEAEVVTKFKVKPSQIADLLALRGDTADGIPGIPAIGGEIAASLLRQHGDIAGIIKAAHNGALIRRAAVRVAIQKNASELKVYKRLTQLHTNVPLAVGFDALKLLPVERSNIVTILKALEAENRITALFGIDRSLTRIAPLLALREDPMRWWKEQLRIIKKFGIGAPRGVLPEAPQPGYYERKLVKGGVFVPARIWREPEVDFVSQKPTGKDLLLCEVGDDRRDPLDQWGWLSQNPIAESEFQHMMAVRNWATKFAPGAPEASPYKPVDFTTAKPPSFKKKRKVK